MQPMGTQNILFRDYDNEKCNSIWHPKMWMSCNLLVVKFVEDIRESILGFEGLFLFIFYTLPRIINQQTCELFEWINEYIPENWIFGYKHTCFQEIVLKLAKAII